MGGVRGLNPSVQLPKQPKIPPLTCLRIEGIWIRSNEPLSESNRNFSPPNPLRLVLRSGLLCGRKVYAYSYAREAPLWGSRACCKSLILLLGLPLVST